MDYFKQYNDYYGHLNGDDVLIAVADTINKVVGEKDALTSRIGGDEFSVITIGQTYEQTKELANKILNAVRNLKIPNLASKDKENKFISVTIGVANTIPNSNSKKLDLQRKADKQLYIAKELGRNQVS